MQQGDMGPLAEHHVVVQIVAQIFPELQGMFIKGAITRQHVVRPNDRGVTPGITASQPAFFYHGNVRDAVVACKIISGCEPVQTGTDNDHVILSFRLRIPPGAIPVFLSGQSVKKNTPGGISFHVVVTRSQSNYSWVSMVPKLSGTLPEDRSLNVVVARCTEKNQYHTGSLVCKQI